MNKRIITFTMLGFLSLASFGFAVNSYKQESNKEYVLVSAEDYYASVTDNMSGTTLLNQLHSIINNSSVKQSYDWSRYEAADEDPNNDNNVILIYTRASDAKSNHVHGSLGWNREHTFPQSKMDGGNGAKSDNHIIFASDNKVNGARSNIKMGVVDEGSVVNDYNGKPTTCKKTSDRFDPHNVARGIVARSTMYAAAMYNFDPTDNFESIETMLAWHFEYPSNDDDARRNEVVYTNQKNRNPFVDHPEYACRIWGNTSSTTKNICGAYIDKQIKIMLNGQSVTESTIDSGSSNLFEASVDDKVVSNVTWSLVTSSDDPYNNDKITLSVSEGKATVTAVKADVAYLKASYSYTVSDTTKTVSSKIKITSVDPVVLESISVDNPKTEYYVGDEFVKPTVIAYYSDNHTEEVQEIASFSGFDSFSAGIKTITVTYQDKQTAFSVTVIEQPVLNSITIDNPKTNYYVGDEFVRPTVMAHYSDNTSLDVTAQTTFTGFNSESAGIKTVTATYLDKQISYIVTILEPDPVLNNISVSNPKTNYTIGDEFVKPTVTANYSDGSSRDVSSQATFSGFDSSTEGTKTITVSYQGKQTTYDITVSKDGHHDPDPEPAPSSGNGCSGNVATASIILSSLALAGIVIIVATKVLRKKKNLG